MLPPGHIAYTWGGLNWLQRRFSLFKDADYRLVALAALLPDLVDKPLALLVFFRRTRAALLFTHTLLAHLAVFAIAYRCLRRGLIYALAFNGHIITDRLWLFPQTFLWPLRGWQFHRWRHLNPGHSMWRAYWHTFIGSFHLLAYELAGLGILAWLGRSYRLYRRQNLVRFLRTGRLTKGRNRRN